MKIRKYYPSAFVYFFVNSAGLPFGLLYTMILTPFFYVWLVLKGEKLILLKFLLLILPFVLNHLINGVDSFNYWRSVFLYLTVYIFTYSFRVYIKCYDLEPVFKKLLLTNFILTLLAIIFLLTPFRSWFWSEWSISTAGLAVHNWPRLLMFTYEPSYYSTLLVPIFCFYFIKFILKQIQENVLLTMTMILLPLILSFSMGVISGLSLSIITFLMVNFSKVLTRKRLLISVLTIVIVSVATLIVLFAFFPQNPLFVRVIAIFAGDDASANGRTYQAFQLGYLIASEKSILWGVGFGQLKVIGDPIIKSFYNYPPNYGQVSIPCTAGETLALFGVIGLILRFLIEIFFFFKTNVLNNYFRTLLFFYIFIYQFTGSFTTNIAEYVIWILAFTNVFPQFDKKKLIG